MGGAIDTRKLNSTFSSRLRDRLWLAGTLLMLTATAAQSADWAVPTGISITGGRGTDVAVYGVETHWDSFSDNAWLKDHGLDTRLSAEIKYWKSRHSDSEHGSLVDLGLMPLLRWSPHREGTVSSYVEAGIGGRLLSHTQIDKRRLSLAAEFSERIGAGFMFGSRHRYEAGIYVQHVSNGRLKQPNNGLTYIGLNLGMQL